MTRASNPQHLRLGRQPARFGGERAVDLVHVVVHRAVANAWWAMRKGSRASNRWAAKPHAALPGSAPPGVEVPCQPEASR
jgi:hypothetical protein